MSVWLVDRARARAFKLGGSPVREVVRDRELRVALSFAAVVVSSFVLTWTTPLLTLALGPVVLGVPHLLADFRYLVVRPGHLERRTLWILALPLVGVSAIQFLPYGGEITPLHGILVGTLIMPLAAVLVRNAHWSRRALAVVVGLLALYLVSLDLYWSTLIFAHGHNFVAVLLFWLWVRRDKRALLPLGLFCLAGALIMTGALDGALTMKDNYIGALAPESIFGPQWSTRLALLFTFAQGVHYGLWLRVIPEDDRRRSTPRSFRQSARAVIGELGAPLVVVFVVAALAVPRLCAPRSQRGANGLPLARGLSRLPRARCALAAHCGRARRGARRAHLMADAWFTDWLEAFVFTQVIEAPIYFYVFRREKVSLALFMSIVPTLLTHPVVWFVWPRLPTDYWTMVAFAEAFAVGAEAVIAFFLIARRPWFCLALAFGCNAASLGLGLLIRFTTGWI